MHVKKSFWIMVLLFSTCILIACDGGGGSSGGGGTGTVSVSLTDSTTNDYLAVYVTIDAVQIRTSDDGSSSTDDPSNDVSSGDNAPDDDSKWKSLEPPAGVQFPKTYNLLKLVNGVTEAIGSGEFSAGTYRQVRLIIGDSPELENNLLGQPHPEANYAVLNDGSNTIKPIKIPSGFQTGIKLVHPFTVVGDVPRELVLDFDACRSVVKAGNSGKYILKPTIKVIESEDKVYIDGQVTDDSEPANPIGGVPVSAQISDGLSATVVRSTATDVEGTENDLEEGDYILSHLSPDQIYNIVVYDDRKVTLDAEDRFYSPQCVAFRWNDPENGFPALPLNFSLSANNSGIGTVSGAVSVIGGIAADFPLVITIYTELDCGHPEGEGYVKLMEVNDISYNDDDDVFEYQVDLPLYDPEVTYYVVASADGFNPATNSVILNTDNLENLEATDVDLTLIQAE